MVSRYDLLYLILVSLALQSCGSSGSTPQSDYSSAPRPQSTPALAALQPTFSSIEANIFAPKCVACHGVSNPAASIDLSSLAALQASAVSHGHSLFEPGDPQGSHILMEVQSGSMPPEGPKLSVSEIQTISDWIAAGAQDN